jgi:hypothetical protein
MMDPTPAGYDFILGGVWNLEPYAVYENPEAFPRAWVVHAWEQLPARADLLHRLKSTNFRATVLLEETPALAPGSAAAQPRGVRVLTDEPDRVVLRVEAGSPGLLILDDLWFPGWTATVGGQPADILRANFLLRAVALDGLEQDVAFRFEPSSYTKGKLVSLAAALVGLIGLALTCRSSRAGVAS